MESRLVIEVLTPSGDVKERHKVKTEELPLNIGRAYSNTIILSDEAVCPSHVRIERNEKGEIVVRDLDSLNGLLDPVTHEDFKEVILLHETSLKLGETTVRFVREDKKVPPARRAKRELSRLEVRLAKPLAACLLSILCFLFYSLFNHFTANFSSHRSDALWVFFGLSLLSYSIIVISSASFWAFVGSLSGRKGRYFYHVALISVLFGFLSPLASTTSILSAAFSNAIISWSAGILLLALPVFLFLSRSLSIAAGIQKRYRTMLSIVFILLVYVGSTTATEIYRIHSPNKPMISSVVIPKKLQVAGGVGVDEFLSYIPNLEKDLSTAE